MCLYKKTHKGVRSFEIWDESYPLTTSLVSFPSNQLDCFYFLKTSIRISDERLPRQPKDVNGLSLMILKIYKVINVICNVQKHQMESFKSATQSGRNWKSGIFVS